MADNPLFPGYKPRREGDIPNPLYPGYSEGQRPYKSFGGSFMGSFEYTGDYWLDQLDQMSMDISNFPKWFVDRFVDDFKRNLKATYNPGDVPLEQMDDYDQDVFPGVSTVSLSLDPFEWKDPGKALESTAKSWIRSATGLRFRKEGWGLEAMPIDLTDYDTNVKTAMWKVAMGVQQDRGKLAEMGARAIAGATRAVGGDSSYGNKLFNFDEASDYLVAGKKAYTAMALNAVEAQRFMPTMKRDAKNDTFIASMAAALDSEINGEYKIDDTPVYDTNGNPVLDANNKVVYTQTLQTTPFHYTKTVTAKDANGQEILDANGKILEGERWYGKRRDLFKQVIDDPANPSRSADFENAAKLFELQQKLASDIKLISDLVGYYTGAVEARMVGNTNAESRWDTPETAGSTKTRFEARTEDLNKRINKRLAATGDDSIDEIIAEMRKIDPETAAAFEKSARHYKEHLKKTQEAINSYTGNNRALYNKLNRMKVAGKELVGGDILAPSVYRDVLRKIDTNIVLPGKLTKIDKKYQIGTYLQELERATGRPNTNGKTIEELFDDDGLPKYKGFFGNQARLVASRLEMDRGSYALEEFYDAVTQGKVLERYVWNRIVKLFTGYTPGELIQQGLNKVGFFGLQIDDDRISYKLKNNPIFVALFRNKFSIQIDNSKGLFQGGQVIKQTYKGTKDLAAVATFGSLLERTSPISDQTLFEFLTNKKQLVENGAMNKALVGKVPAFWDMHVLETYQKELDRFYLWLQEHGAALGLSKADLATMDPIIQEKVLLLFHALNKENKFYGSLKITKEFSGLIQKIGVSLNKLQDKIFGFPVIQKIIKPLLQIKTLASETAVRKVSDLISKLTAKAAVTLTGGTAAIVTYLLEKVIKPVVRVIVRKAVEFGQNVIGALAQGDINKVMAQIDKEMGNLVKFSMYAVVLPGLILVAFMQGLFGTVISTVSPIDPTKDNAGYGAATTYQGLSTSENAYVRIEKSVETITYEGSFVNRAAPLDNSTVDSPNHISVIYTVKVTAKQGFDAGSVTYTDIATRYGIDGSTSTIFSIGPKDLGAMNEGDVLELSSPAAFPATSLSGGIYHDSLITNVFTLNFVGDLLIENLAPLQVSRTFGIGAVQSQVPGCENLPVGIMPTKNTALNPSVPGDAIAIRAYEIALTLSRGFWCNFNNSSEYPEYFNSSLFASNPFPTYPGDIQDDVNALFWCSWLTAKSYRSVYPTFPDSPSLRYAQFSDTFVQNKTPGGPWVYKSRADTPYTEIHPGDAIFFERYPSDGLPDHIGIVYKVTPDGITTVESNNIVLSVYIPIGPDGRVAEAVEGALYVMGFGSHE